MGEWPKGREAEIPALREVPQGHSPEEAPEEFKCDQL